MTVGRRGCVDTLLDFGREALGPSEWWSVVSNSKPRVAVVGRPNVGKSTLVNRIVGRRAAVVQEKPGVTRDRREFEAEWNGRSFTVVDTGGWQRNIDAELVEDIRVQAEAAIATADVIIFVIDAQGTISTDDAAVADLLRPVGRGLWWRPTRRTTTWSPGRHRRSAA